MSAVIAALDVIEASLDEQLTDWSVDSIWSNWIENMRTETRVYISGKEVNMSGVRISVPWTRRRQLRLAVERWAARKAVSKFREPSQTASVSPAELQAAA